MKEQLSLLQFDTPAPPRWPEQHPAAPQHPLIRHPASTRKTPDRPDRKAPQNKSETDPETEALETEALETAATERDTTVSEAPVSEAPEREAPKREVPERETPKRETSGQTQSAADDPRAALLKHPNLWRAGELSRQRDLGLATGYAALDDHLPGAGWPANGLVELLLPCAGIGELRLLLPALAELSRRQQRWVAWVNPPFIPYAPALQAAGVDINKILLIHPRQHDEALWALERACRSGTCSAALAWLDESKLKLKDTQRLQVAAKQGGTLTCLLRPHSARQQPSMAELRLALEATDSPGRARLDIVKRRGGWPLEDLEVSLCGRTPHPPGLVAQQMAAWQEARHAQLSDSVAAGPTVPVH